MRISEAARELGVSVSTLRMWELKRYIRDHRTATGQRYYTKEDIKEIRITMKMTKRPKQEPLASPKQSPAPYIPEKVDWEAVRKLNSTDFIAWRLNEGKHLDHTVFPDDLNKQRFAADRGLYDFVWTRNPGDEDKEPPPIMFPQQLDAIAEQRKREAQGLT